MLNFREIYQFQNIENISRKKYRQCRLDNYWKMIGDNSTDSYKELSMLTSLWEENWYEGNLTYCVSWIVCAVPACNVFLSVRQKTGSMD